MHATFLPTGRVAATSCLPRSAWAMAVSFAAAAALTSPTAHAAPAAAVPVAAMPAVAAPAAAAICMACHGAHGEGASSGIPRLAGQDAEYLSHALSMFKQGTRASTTMQPIAKALGDPEIRALADYFSTQAPPPVDQRLADSSGLAATGQRLAQNGAGSLPACFACHGAAGAGNGARFPRIAGQPAQFVVDRLHEFQARARAKAPEPGTMTAVSVLLDESQIQATAAYLSKLDR